MIGVMGCIQEEASTDFNTNNCKFPGDHIVDGQIVKHACSFCFKETGKICHHNPVNIQNVLKWFKHLQNVIKPI